MRAKWLGFAAVLSTSVFAYVGSIQHASALAVSFETDGRNDVAGGYAGGIVSGTLNVDGQANGYIDLSYQFDPEYSPDGVDGYIYYRYDGQFTAYNTSIETYNDITEYDIYSNLFSISIFFQPEYYGNNAFLIEGVIDPNGPSAIAYGGSATFAPTVLPLPSSVTLLGATLLGLGGLSLARRRAATRPF